jgi:hypothetical protein
VAAKNGPPEEIPIPETAPPSPRRHVDERESSANGDRGAFGAIVVVAGLAVVAACLAVALYVYRNVASATDSATAVATVLAPVTGVIGTVIGAYFGFQAGSAGTAMAQAAADEAQAGAMDALRSLAAVAAVTPAAASDQIHEILGVPPPSSRSGSRTAF